jgi:hypothetical protein
VTSALRSALAGALRGGTSAVLATSSSTDVLTTALVSWLVSIDESTIAAAIDVRGAAFSNIMTGNDQVALEVLADDLILSVRGKATILRDRMASAPFPCALVHIKISGIRDHTLQAMKFQGPRYHWVDPKGHRTDVERAIFKELAESSPAT